MKDKYFKDIQISGIQRLIIQCKNFTEIYLLILLVLLITGILIFKFDNNDPNNFTQFFTDLIDLSITVFIGGILVTVASSLYNTQQENNKIRKDLIDKLLKSYFEVKRIRRIQEYNKNKIGHNETQLHDLIEVQLKFENYMNQIDLYRNVFNKEKANILFDMAHQIEHYLNELCKAFANSKQQNNDPNQKQSQDDLINEEKIKNFIDDVRFNNDFSYLFHESLGLIRDDFLCHTKMPMNNEEYSNARSILTRAQCMEMKSESK